MKLRRQTMPEATIDTAMAPASSSTPNVVLELQGVTSGYMGDSDVLRNVSIRVRQGQISGLLGLNVAGKSTLFKTVYGFLQPKTGQVRLGGADITGVAPHDLIDKGLWYIPQESSLFPYMTVEENLRLPLEGRRKQFGSVLKTRFNDTLERFPVLRDKLRQQAGDLSGGQQKTLEFAKAYMVQPRVCLIDEPGIGLAPKVASEVFDWIRIFADSGMG